MDYFLDNPKFKFSDCYHGIPVFRLKPAAPGKAARFWFGSVIGDEKIIVVGPGSTPLDLTYALAYMLKFSLKNHFIICCDDYAALSVDIRYLKMIDPDIGSFKQNFLFK